MNKCMNRCIEKIYSYLLNIFLKKNNPQDTFWVSGYISKLIQENPLLENQFAFLSSFFLSQNSPPPWSLPGPSCFWKWIWVCSLACVPADHAKHLPSKWGNFIQFFLHNIKTIRNIILF